MTCTEPMPHFRTEDFLEEFVSSLQTYYCKHNNPYIADNVLAVKIGFDEQNKIYKYHIAAKSEALQKQLVYFSSKEYKFSLL
jgi:hypothetical protein